MNVIHREGFPEPCHSLFHLNVFKTTAPGSLSKLGERLKVTGISVVTVVMESDRFDVHLCQEPDCQSVFPFVRHWAPCENQLQILCLLSLLTNKSFLPQFIPITCFHIIFESRLQLIKKSVIGQLPPEQLINPWKLPLHDKYTRTLEKSNVFNVLILLQ